MDWSLFYLHSTNQYTILSYQPSTEFMANCYCFFFISSFEINRVALKTGSELEQNVSFTMKVSLNIFIILIYVDVKFFLVQKQYVACQLF